MNAKRKASASTDGGRNSTPTASEKSNVVGAVPEKTKQGPSGATARNQDMASRKMNRGC